MDPFISLPNNVSLAFLAETIAHFKEARARPGIFSHGMKSDNKSNDDILQLWAMLAFATTVFVVYKVLAECVKLTAIAQTARYVDKDASWWIRVAQVGAHLDEQSREREHKVAMVKAANPVLTYHPMNHIIERDMSY